MNENEKLIQNLQNTVKDSQAELDARTLGQLRAARRTAIESLTNQANYWWHFSGKKFAIACMLVITLTTSIFYPLYFDQSEGYDLGEIALSEDLELLRDLDFYFWIADTVENEG